MQTGTTPARAFPGNAKPTAFANDERRELAASGLSTADRHDQSATNNSVMRKPDSAQPFSQNGAGVPRPRRPTSGIANITR